MEKIKLIGGVIIALELSFAIIPKPADAFTFQTVCQKPLTKFSNDSSTFDISFPPGGGKTCDTFPPANSNCPTIMLPAKETVFSMKVDMVSKGKEIGTPYIWVPISLNPGYIIQIDTKDGSEGEIARYKVGNDPSRTFVIPGGDVWVANRVSGDVTKLSPLTGNKPAGGTCGDGKCGTDETIYSCSSDCAGNICGNGAGTCKNNVACGSGTENCKEYKVVGSYAVGNGPRGVTGDINGFVWVGNYTDGTIVKFNPATELIEQTITVGGGPYGLIADPYGHVWVSNRSAGFGLQCIESATGIITNVYPVNLSYGIGMGKDGSIYLACHECGTVLKFDAVTAANCPASIIPSATYDTGVVFGTRGVAVDQNNYVWTANSGSNKFYLFTSPANRYEVTPGGTNLIGAAIDFNGYGWTVSFNNGDVYKYSFNGASLNLKYSMNVGTTNLYNYSDMTGLRTIPKTISVGGITVPFSSTNTFEICTDGTTTCSNATPCSLITAYLASCVPDAMNNCEVPLEIFSIQAGDYTLQNLEVIYGEQAPVITGGLVPCGREWDDLATAAWDERDSCNLCRLILMVQLVIEFLVKMVAVAALVSIAFGGFLYVFATGSQGTIEKAKSMIKYTLLGFVIVFIAWALINTIITTTGYIDPLNGDWYAINC